MTQYVLKYKENFMFCFFSLSSLLGTYFSFLRKFQVYQLNRQIFLNDIAAACIGFHASLLCSILTRWSVQFLYLLLSSMFNYSFVFIFFIPIKTFEAINFISEDLINVYYFIISHLYIYFSFIAISSLPQLLPRTIVSSINIIKT